MCVVFAWALCAAPAHASACADADTPYTPLVNEPQVRSALVCLINNERVARGLEPVKPVVALDVAAQRHVEDMVARGFLGHLAPEPAPFGVTPHERAEAAGYRGGSRWEVGEVMHFIARGETRPQLTTARSAMTDWMASAPHCAALLTHEARHAGVGLVHSAAEEGLVTETVEVVVGAPGMVMTRFGGCPSADGLVAPNTPPAAPPPPAPEPRGEAIGSTGLYLSDVQEIKLRRGASAAPLKLQCGRTTGRCRASVTLKARGRVLGRASIVMPAGKPRSLSVPIARQLRKALLRRSTRATLSLAVGSSRATRNVTLRG